MNGIVFGCPFCGAGTKAVSVERKRVLSKCDGCEMINVYVYGDDKAWHFEHSEEPKEKKG